MAVEGMEQNAVEESIMLGVFRRLSLSGWSSARRDSLTAPLVSLFNKTVEESSANLKEVSESLSIFLSRLFSPDPRLYQEFTERGLISNSQESDDDLLEDSSAPAERRPDDGIVVKNYRPAQLIWSQLPQVGVLV